MRSPLAFELGAGQIAGTSHKEDPPVYMLGSRSQAGFCLLITTTHRYISATEFASMKKYLLLKGIQRVS